jgi:hypothetical protein
MGNITPQQQSSAHRDQARRSNVVKAMRKLDRTLKEVYFISDDSACPAKKTAA